jgi:hypothetical protein
MKDLFVHHQRQGVVYDGDALLDDKFQQEQQKMHYTY